MSLPHIELKPFGGTPIGLLNQFENLFSAQVRRYQEFQ